VKIYTRTGDDGTTGLFSGERVSKTHPRVEAYGAVDELNSALGLARALGAQARVATVIIGVQKTLFTLGSDLATRATGKAAIPRIGADEITHLEGEIDRMTAELPPLRTFILPGGTPAGAQLQLVRAIARRAERAALRLAAEEAVNAEALVYMNRLSDFFFTLARFENFLAGRAEEAWISGA